MQFRRDFMLQIIKDNWDKILDTLKEEQELSDVSYNTWLVPLEPYALEDGVFTILYPGEPMGLGYIERKYKLFLTFTIEEITGIKCEINFILPSGLESGGKKSKARPETTISTAIQEANLNPKYTFDTFVVGSNNKMAHAASLAVAESPAEVYNPLFIYGGVGLGKTHLMHVTSEKFTNELIDAIRNKNNISTTEFREKYRTIDVLLIDDIQFIVGKESTQEEFFHTFNSLHDDKKQIIISSDRPPKDIETLEERLRSRFEWGLTVDIQPPDYETRMAILRKKEELEGYNIDNEVIKYIANNIKSKLDKKEITIELAEEALKDLISPNQSREITPELIIQVVSDHFNLNPLDIASVKRNKEIVYPRQIVMYLCREMTAAPLQMVGKYLGNRDHTTIIHGHDKIQKDLETSETLRNTIEVLKKKISAS